MGMQNLKARLANRLKTATAPGQSDTLDFSDAELMEVASAPNDIKVQHEEIKPNLPDTKQVDVLGLETIPRETVIKLFKTPWDVEFEFKVKRSTSDLYINSMRQVMSRARRQARRDKYELPHAKVLVMGVTRAPTHDVITLIRTQSASLRQKTVNAELLKVMQDISENEGGAVANSTDEKSEKDE